jgi:hypothetical protein
MFNCNFLVYLKLGVDEAFFSILKKGQTVFFVAKPAVQATFLTPRSIQNQ